MPTQEESETWANERESQGKAHYVAEYCEDGRIQHLTKRLNKKVFFRYDYIYENGQLASVRQTANAEERMLHGR